MKRAVSISLRFVALVAMYMLIGWAFGMYEAFSIWRMLLMGVVFSGIMSGFSEWQNCKKEVITVKDKYGSGQRVRIFWPEFFLTQSFAPRIAIFCTLSVLDKRKIRHLSVLDNFANLRPWNRNRYC